MKTIKLDEIRRLADENLTRAQIARRLGVSLTTIYKRLNPALYERAKAATKERQRRTKKALIEYKGGKCSVCGYNKCQQALDFHHTGKKSFTIGNRKGAPIEVLKKEADKCILLCRNCHAELHAEINTRNEAQHIKQRYNLAQYVNYS